MSKWNYKSNIQGEKMKIKTSPLTNDEKIKRVKQRKILKGFIIFFGLLTLLLAIHSLITKFTPIPAIISFVIEALLSNYRNKLDPKVEVSDSKNQE